MQRGIAQRADCISNETYEAQPSTATGFASERCNALLPACTPQVLHRLELNLDPLLGRLPVRVLRAYARQLQLSVPWTAIGTQPIQVCVSCPSYDHLAVACRRGGS